MSKKILIIDDDLAILDVLRVILQDEGFEIATISESLGTTSKIKKFTPDLILLDYWLPGLNGGKLARTLRQKKETSKIPIVMISANHISLSKVHEMGADDFLAKPFDIIDLINVVKKNLPKN